MLLSNREAGLLLVLLAAVLVTVCAMMLSQPQAGGPDCSFNLRTMQGAAVRAINSDPHGRGSKILMGALAETGRECGFNNKTFACK